MMAGNREEQKRLAAERAIGYVDEGSVLGVGTGSTVAHFIDALGARRGLIEAAVSSSEQSTARLKQHGIRVVDLNSVGTLALYVDGADECDPHKRLIKGGGGALTREKIIAAASKTFVCMIDAAKRAGLEEDAAKPVTLRVTLSGEGGGSAVVAPDHALYGALVAMIAGE